MVIHRTAVRNREIFAACQDGKSIEELAQKYGLSPVTVRQVIRIEGHKFAVSVERFYQELRSQKHELQS
jgi:Mor family transcriptional regulator